MATTLGIDGPTEVALLPSDGCCPPSICQITLCSLICNFVNALPRGPLWDRAKMEASSRASRGGCDGNDCTDPCASVVSHAIYAANRLYLALHEALWPALRESDPFSAFVTVDDWLDRLGWRNCFASQCRSPLLGDLTPLEYLGTDGRPVHYDPPYSADLVLAVKLATVRALALLDLGIIANVNSVNAVIEPLGARVVAVGASCAPWPCLPGCEPPDSNCAEPGATPDMSDPTDPCCPRCDHPVWRIEPSTETFIKPSMPRCDLEGMNTPNTETIPSFYDRTASDPAGIPAKIYPGVLAAECIVRSLVMPGTYLEILRA